MACFFGLICGFIGWFTVRYILGGFYTIDQNERAVKTVFGRAERIEGKTILDDPIATAAPGGADQVQLSPGAGYSAGGPYFKWPWEKIHRVSIATQTVIYGL